MELIKVKKKKAISNYAYPYCLQIINLILANIRVNTPEIRQTCINNPTAYNLFFESNIKLWYCL